MEPFLLEWKYIIRSSECTGALTTVLLTSFSSTHDCGTSGDESVQWTSPSTCMALDTCVLCHFFNQYNINSSLHMNNRLVIINVRDVVSEGKSGSSLPELLADVLCPIIAPFIRVSFIAVLSDCVSLSLFHHFLYRGMYDGICASNNSCFSALSQPLCQVETRDTFSGHELNTLLHFCCFNSCFIFPRMCWFS